MDKFSGKGSYLPFPEKIISKREIKMKICIPSETGTGFDSKVYGHFGSAPFFNIVDIETGQIEIVNNADEHHVHGACNPAASIAGKGVKAVICAGMGAGAVSKLNAAGIKVYFGNFGSISGCVEAFKHNEIPEMKANDACHGHECK